MKKRLIDLLQQTRRLLLEWHRHARETAEDSKHGSDCRQLLNHVALRGTAQFPCSYNRWLWFEEMTPHTILEECMVNFSSGSSTRAKQVQLPSTPGYRRLFHPEAGERKSIALFGLEKAPGLYLRATQLKASS